MAKILLTGANGYIGQRLMPVLLEAGHEVYACVRDASRLPDSYRQKQVQIIEIDWLENLKDDYLPSDIDIAYYLIHSMAGKGDFTEKESRSATNFLSYIQKTTCRQIIYLSGIVNQDQLSRHLDSRLTVEKILQSGSVPLTTLRAGIIVGSGSASFEIIRDLVEKLPIMIAPKWINTRCQPIAIRNVIHFLEGVMDRRDAFGQTFDIGGPDILTYKQMMLQFAEVRRLKRWIISVPVMTPRLSSYWLYFITSTTWSLAAHLVDSMKIDVIARPNDLAARLNIALIPYKESVQLAFRRIEQNMVVSSWKDAFIASGTSQEIMKYVEVPKFGCFVDSRSIPVDDKDRVLDNIWRIGGKRGWYYGNWMWKLRGYLDKIAGGVGLRRGRTNEYTINPGDALDFWRVLIADRKQARLLLYAEMKLPGEAWLEFEISTEGDRSILRQTATFRPLGVWGRLYWWLVQPFHFFVFDGMLNKLANYREPVLAA